MTVYFRTLCSGSDGNCTFISDGYTHLLVDAGLALRTAEDSLRACGVSPSSLTGILVTHEHTDHIRSLDAISAKYDVPIYATYGTWAMLECKHIRRAALKNRISFDNSTDFYIGDFNIQPFSIPHDAADPVGYSLVNHGKTIVIATDMGHTKGDFMSRVKDAGVILLEANYDPLMLENGPYPRNLKQRISGRNGHLSNDDCARTLCSAVESGSARNFVLGHLSQNNNTPELAYETSASALARMGLCPGKDIALSVAPRFTPGELFTL